MAKKHSTKTLSRLVKAYGLKPKEARFVMHFVELGSQAAAARALNMSSQLASYYYNKENVHAAIDDYLGWVMPDLAAQGLSIIRGLAENAEDEATQLSAAKELVKHGLEHLKKPKVHKHVHQIDDTSVMLDRIEELKGELGLHGKVIEGEFEEVEAPETEERGSNRLARLPFKAG